MELALVVAARGEAARDVLLEVDGDANVAGLARVVTERVQQHEVDDAPALFHVRLRRWLHDAETITNLGLRRGDELLVSPRRTGPATTRARHHGGLELAIVAGPDSGRRFPFGDGGVVVGRSRSADATLSDPSVSRRHCAFELTDGVIRVVEVRAPIFVEGRAIGPGAGLRVGELVTLGSTVAVVREAENEPQVSESDGQRRPDERGRPDEHGRLAFNRPPRGQTVSTRFEVTLGAPPDRPRRIMLSGATALAPLLMGGAMLVLTRNPLMLVFMALSPVMAVWSYVEERRRGHRAFRVEAHAFRARLEYVIEQVRSATVVERNVRRAGAPDTACLVARAESQASTLWERRAFDDDFLRLRLGWARHRSLARVTVEAGGSAELRAEAEQVISDASERPLAPSVVDLRAAGSLGLAGPRPLVHRSATWFVVQLATLHSPSDVSIELAIESSSLDWWDWAKWLPHTRGLADRDSCGLALGSTEAGALIERLAQVVAARVRHSRSLTASDAPEVRIVAFIDEATDVDRPMVARLLAEGPDVGVHVVWLGTERKDLPGECGATVELIEPCRARVRRHANAAAGARGSRDEADDDVVEMVDQLGPELAVRVARRLAPLRDVGASRDTGTLPRTVGLLELLGCSDPRPVWLLERWRSRRAFDAIIGVSVDGPTTVDLTVDGPHALVAGTTGSGKSELLQTLVASLAATHCRARCTFLLIDYKGGSAFRECVRLPHTVGCVTDLDGYLSQRVLASLRAELRYREVRLRERGAKDLAELEALGSDSAFPRLVIVIDEFAALVREVPEFVDGVVDIAQRGRSLGLHLVLATQRPNGVVSENIRANTNLRIALRVHDVADSRDVVQSDDAARIPRFLPGRALMRTGHAELTALQCAYGGGDTTAERSDGSRCRELVFGAAPDPARLDPAGPDPARLDPASLDPASLDPVRCGRSDLARLVDAVASADRLLDQPAARRPWLPPLPSRLALDACRVDVEERDPARLVGLGVLDEPDQQRQRVWSVDFERDGSVIVFGASGSGKTTALLSIAGSLATAASPVDVQLYALDFASRGLEALAALPHCGAVIVGTHTERVVRTLEMLEHRATERRRILAEAGVASVGEYRARRLGEMPRVIVMVDGYANFAAAFERVEFGDWIECLHRLVSNGRSVGIHFVITAERRGSVPAPLLSAVSVRVVLRMADGDDLVALGVPAKVAKAAILPPGRGFVGEVELQLGIAGDPETGIGPALRVLADAARAKWTGASAPPIRSLPADVRRSSFPTPESGLRPYLGVRDQDFEPIAIDLNAGAFLVAGSARSGRTTAVWTMATSIVAAGDSDVRCFEPRGRPNKNEIDGVERIVGLDACEDALLAVAARVREQARERPLVLAVDDLTDLIDGPAGRALEEMVRVGHHRNVHVIAAVDAYGAARSFGGCVAEIRRAKHGLLLRPDLDLDGDLLGVRLRARPGQRFPVGRGFLVQHGIVELIQVAGE